MLSNGGETVKQITTVIYIAKINWVLVLLPISKSKFKNGARP